jgi:hypothetical protein
MEVEDSDEKTKREKGDTIYDNELHENCATERRAGCVSVARFCANL